jgi:adenosylcobinamide-GDP ribazoletransferase
MKRLFNGFIMSLSMFSIIPMSMVWDEAAMCLVGPFLPLTGLIIGVLWFGFSVLLTALNIPQALQGAALLLFPLFLSGFIHIDGLMDVCDAVCSRADIDKKRAILKDPHIGAFAACGLGVYLLLGFASLNGGVAEPFLLVVIPVMSRSIAAFTLMTEKSISETGFTASFKKGVRMAHKAVPVCVLFLCPAIVWVFRGGAATLPLWPVFLLGSSAARYAIKHLGGVSGDVCGFTICVSELCILIAMALI